MNCHIQEIPENGADLAHFKAIHNASVLAGGIDPLNSVLRNAGNHHWEAVYVSYVFSFIKNNMLIQFLFSFRWRPSKAPTKHLASVTLKHSIELTKKLHVFEMDVTGEQV